MPRVYKPLPNFCFVKPYEKPSKAGLIIKGLDSEVYEIVCLPEKLTEEQQVFEVGTKIIVKNGWRGFKVYEDKQTDATIFCVDFNSVIAILE